MSLWNKGETVAAPGFYFLLGTMCGLLPSQPPPFQSLYCHHPSLLSWTASPETRLGWMQISQRHCCQHKEVAQLDEQHATNNRSPCWPIPGPSRSPLKLKNIFLPPKTRSVRNRSNWEKEHLKTFGCKYSFVLVLILILFNVHAGDQRSKFIIIFGCFLIQIYLQIFDLYLNLYISIFQMMRTQKVVNVKVDWEAWWGRAGWWGRRRREKQRQSQGLERTQSF